jgi:hypothetical protein
VLKLPILPSLGHLVSARRQSQTVQSPKLSPDAVKIRTHAEYLVENHEWLRRVELYRRYNEVKVWFQMYFYRQTGYLYRFAEIPTGPLYYQGCEIADQMNRMLIRLYDLERGDGNG